MEKTTIVHAPSIVQGHAIAFFAFDIGYEVTLEHARHLLASQPAQPLSRKKQKPTYLQYTTPPQVVQWGRTEELQGQPGTIQITLYDFGAVSVAYRWPLQHGLPLTALPQASADIYLRTLENDARHQVLLFTEQIRPAITRPDFSTLVEDYYVFVVERLDHPLDAETLLGRYGDSLAQTLRLDTQLLSDEQQENALDQHISYYKNDLVVVDWNAAIIYDQDYEDALNILELLNVELLEARYIDAQLDRRIGNYERLRQQRTLAPMPLRTPYRKDIEALSDLRLDSALLSERVDNALKLIGDDYLARVHTAASQRFYLQEWDAAIARKLSIVSDLYQLLTDRINTAQGHALELIVIALILIEIVLGLIHLH